MAIIKKLPGTRVISGFKGVLDFYVYMGLACVRSWPRKPKFQRSPEVRAQWPIWAYVSKHWNSLSPEVRRAYEETATGSSLTGRDLFTKSFISDYFRDSQWE